MSKRSLLFPFIVATLTCLLVTVGIFAATKAPDVIKMENKAYKKHTRGIVMFSHSNHAEAYAKKHPEFYKNGCGECHHDENNKPLTNLKSGDPVEGCIACHKKPGYITGKKAKGLSAEQKREYHANAIHDNCQGCHRAYNKKNKLKSKDAGWAPTTCNKCHPKKKK
jgi:hypothetical protein